MAQNHPQCNNKSYFPPIPGLRDVDLYSLLHMQKVSIHRYSIQPALFASSINASSYIYIQLDALMFHIYVHKLLSVGKRLSGSFEDRK